MASVCAESVRPACRLQRALHASGQLRLVRFHRCGRGNIDSCGVRLVQRQKVRRQASYAERIDVESPSRYLAIRPASVLWCGPDKSRGLLATLVLRPQDKHHVHLQIHRNPVEN